MHRKMNDQEWSAAQIENAPSKVTTLKCSYCGSLYQIDESTTRPFCSVRCQQLDLRNWLSESYGLPWEGEGDRELIDEQDDDETAE
ncbi:MAG: DNA gyrase inhibitor YacG [Pirellulaceae bacterium]